MKRQPESEGLDRVFSDAGAEWRDAGCSMCLGMNPDILQPGERCASTSNRNFEGRQGRGGRTHLVSPAMAAAAAVEGRITDVRRLQRASRRPVVRPFRCEHGTLVPLDRSDVDTDQIIPKQFLKRIERTGFGPFLFHDWRYDDGGAERPDFVLNRDRVPRRHGARRRAQLRLRLVARARGLGARRTTASARSSRRRSPTSSAATRSAAGCCR